MQIDKAYKNQIPSLQKLWQEAFGDTEDFLNVFFKTAFSADRCRCVIVNNEIAAALYWFDCLYLGKPIAYIYAVATAKKYREQGFCQKLMTNTHQHLVKRGYAGAILVPGSEALFEFYKKLGYHTCSHIRKFNCNHANVGIPLRLIKKSEYARLRRRFLPEGSVIQENENLDFLQTQVHFYTGAGFLLAAYEEPDFLYGAELLGDVTIAPKIVQTLGYTKGTFRTPGENIPFAMYYPLGNKHLPPPTYFGLAFD